MKNSALKPQYNLKSRYELISDYDYLNKLSEKEKEWLNNFNEEYVNANFNHEGKILHKTKKLKKACYDANNARQRCILTKSKACGKLDYLEEMKKKK